MFENVFQRIKNKIKNDDELVLISFRVEKRTKIELQKIALEAGFSMSKILLGLTDDFIEDYKVRSKNEK
jgi:uncharacterized protein YihD (DUF1040 family)